MRNDGSESEDIFVSRMVKRFGEKNVFIEKYTDTKQIKGIAKTGFAKKAPADFIVTANGDMYYAEVKSTQEKVSFPTSCFTTSQRRAMIRQQAAGGVYMVFIHRMVTDEWYAVPSFVILTHEQTTKTKSIKWSDLNEYRW